MTLKRVTIICPIYNEEKYIDKCIHSIINQDYPRDLMELFFIDGLSTDNTQKKVESYIKQYNFIKLFENPQRFVPQALNIGIKQSKGDVIMRIDGHCIYPVNYVSTLVKYLYELNADNVGAVWNTLPARDNSVCRAIAIATSHKFGVGDSKHKIGAKEIIETDTVPFGCYHRNIFDKIGLFDEELIRNQDDEFNARLTKSGGKIYLIPQLAIDYYARDAINKTAKMYFQYGMFKPLVNKKIGSAATIRQFFPSLFVLGLTVGFLTSFFSKILLIIYISVILLYLLMSIVFSVEKYIDYKDIKLIYILPFMFFTLHISYGLGYWNGIYKILLKKKFLVNTSR